MRGITAFIFLVWGVTYVTAGYCYDSSNQPVSVGQQYRIVCHICICGSSGRPIHCSDNLCNQQRPRTVSRASVHQLSNLHVPVKTPNKASVPVKTPLNPHVALKTPHQAPILPKPPHGRLAAKLFKHMEPSITAVAAAKSKPPKKSKYA